MSTSNNSSLCRVSVVVPVYNAEQYLAECIDSIISQTYKDFELILVEDGAKDSSGRICDDYAQRDSRIKVIHQQNGGVTAARRHGVEEAQGEWITFVDADDKLEVAGLEKLVAVAEQDSELDIVEGAYTWFYPDGTAKIRQNIALKSNKQVFFNGHEYAVSLCQEFGAFRGPVAKLIRRSLLESGVFDIPKWITNREDTMMLTITAQIVHKYVMIPEVVYNYRQQFGITAISNKLSFDYWSEYLRYFGDCALKNKKEWNDVWFATQRDVFSFIINQGLIGNGNAPKYFRESVLPSLTSNIARLTQAQRLYVKALNSPKCFRMFFCVVLNIGWYLKTSMIRSKNSHRKHQL